ncbi:calcium-binding protein [Dinoroseobacter sp. S124A]|uniref:calcium-binding protein n=1 Tax=Dinoroseobacter sp. S124A TaxID=3415128 RepID=UPI003C7D92A1
MTSLSVVLGKVRTIDGDLDDFASAAAAGSGLFTGLNSLIATPATLADALDDARAVLSLPSTAVNLLKSAPFGIGTAVKLFESATSSVRTTLGTYSTTIRRFDDVLEPVATALPSFIFAFNSLGTTVVAVSAGFQVVTKDVRLLEQSFGDDPTLQPFTDLSEQLIQVEEGLDEYLAVRDAVVGALEPVLAELEAAVTAVQALFPPLNFVEDLDATLNAIYAPIVSALNGLIDALDFEIIGINVLDVIGFVADVLGFALGLIEGVVTDFLELLGIDLFGAIDGLLSDLLAPLAPVLDIVDQLETTLVAAVAPLGAVLDEVFDTLGEAASALNTLRINSLSVFDNVIEGDQGEGGFFARINNTLNGTEGSDAIFGLQGFDRLGGGPGDDFIFGGDGFDIISTGSGRDEAWGNAGRDVLINDSDSGSLFGGEGKDILIGKASDGGTTNMFGEAGDDTLIGQGTNNYYFFNGEDYGDDTVIGFGQPGDLIFLEFVEFAAYFDDDGFDAEAFAADNMSVEARGTRLTTEEGSVLFRNVFETETLTDSFIFG